MSNILQYEFENRNIFNKHLKMMEHKLSDYVPKIYNDTEYFALIVEPRISNDFEVVVKTVMYYLNENNSDIKWGLQIFHGLDNFDSLKNKFTNWDNVIYKNTGVCDFNKLDYNSYFKSYNFWKEVIGKKVLTFQLDSILIRNGIDEFLKYDYIGAPWIKSKENSFVGNGGLSLRTVEKMREISKKNTDLEPKWEDIFFVKHLKNNEIADMETASKFSVEDIYHSNPLGVHNPIKIETNLLKNLLKY
jgi:hypothetical protein